MSKAYPTVGISSAFYEVYFCFYFDNPFNTVLVLDKGGHLTGLIGLAEMKKSLKTSRTHIANLTAADVMRENFSAAEFKRLGLLYRPDFTMTSYAQFNEDVILQYALYDVSRIFYIDVGAYDPVQDSVTNWFYTTGRGRGINIEPQLECYYKLTDQRPEDINIQAGCGECSEIITFHKNGVYSTFIEELAREDSVTIDVPVMPLKDICKLHVPHNQTIHFLKIDVEGYEKEVLSGADFKAFRPWIIVVEATNPSTNEPNYEIWEDILTANGYNLAVSHRINRYYVSQEKADLAHRFLPDPALMINVLIRGMGLQSLDILSEGIDAMPEEGRNMVNTLETENGKVIDSGGRLWSNEHNLHAGTYNYEFCGENFSNASFMMTVLGGAKAFEIKINEKTENYMSFNVELKEHTENVVAGCLNPSKNEDVKVRVTSIRLQKIN